MSREIPLTRGLFAIIDDDDFDSVSKKKWTALVCARVNYATHYWRDKSSGGKYGKIRAIRMHSFIMSPPDGMQIDHIDGDGLNNQKSNLRVCTRSQNLGNSRAANGKLLPKGVFANASKKNPFFASCAGKHLGCFPDMESAVLAYDRAALSRWGEFSRLNNPQTVGADKLTTMAEILGEMENGKAKAAAKAVRGLG